MISLARSEPGTPVLPKQLDADPWLLNVRNGTTNLRTGQPHGHRPADRTTLKWPIASTISAGCS